MKYSVEYVDGQYIETLEVVGHVVTKIWRREEFGTVTGLVSHDKDFSEQLKEVLDESILNDVSNFFDDSVTVSDIEDFVMLSSIE